MTKKDLYNILIKEQLDEAVDKFFSEEAFKGLLDALFINFKVSNPQFIGKGYNGLAYKFGNKVMKITRDESEAEMKNTLMRSGHLKHLPKIFSTNRINLQCLRKFHYQMDDDLFIIIQEYAQPLTNEWHIFFQLFYVLLQNELDYLDMVTDYIRNFDDIREAMLKKTDVRKELLDEFYELLREMYSLKIDSIDFKTENFGLSKSGKLIFFDIGSGYGGLYIKNEIII